MPESQRSALMLERMDAERYSIPPAVVLSSECGDMLQKLLKPSPSQRISLDQVGPRKVAESNRKPVLFDTPLAQ
jgi:hypothetical protein